MKVSKPKTFVRLAGKVNNTHCPLCRVKLTPPIKGDGPKPPDMETREHLLPQALTGNRPWDLLICHKCNGEKSDLDQTIVGMARLAAYSTKTFSDFQRQLDSQPRSILALMKRDEMDWLDKTTEKQRTTDGILFPGSVDAYWKTWFWMVMLAKCVYYLETGKFCVQGRRRNGKIIEWTGINPAGTAETRRHYPGWIEGWHEHPQAQVFDDGNVVWLCESVRRKGLLVSLGGRYVWGVAVFRYTEKAYLDWMERFLKENNVHGLKPVGVKDGSVEVQHTDGRLGLASDVKAMDYLRIPHSLSASAKREMAQGLDSDGGTAA